MPEKIDKRIIKTKAAIRKELSALLVDKNIDDITITELTTKCKINRATFYSHYNTIHDVLDDIENQIINNLVNVVSNFNVLELKFEPYPLFKAVSSELINYDHVAKFLLSSNYGNQLVTKIKREFTILLIKNYVENTHNEDRIYLEKISRASIFLMSGAFDLFQEWYLKEGDKISLEELSFEISRLISYGVSSFS